MIKAGDRIKIKPEWQDEGDSTFEWFAIDDEEKGRVTIVARTGQRFEPTSTVNVDMLVGR